jgi:hypothetical protein
MSDGAVIKIDEHEGTVVVLAEKLPPVYDLAVLP